MLIDWFTVAAQTLNFLILVWLMKRYLYQPILRAIDAREKRIAAELADADAKKAEARSERDEYEKKNEDFNQQRASLFRQATDDAKAEQQRILDEARQSADDLATKRRDALTREYLSLNEEITRRTREEVFSIARKTLVDLAGVSLENRISEVFVQRLRELDSAMKANFAKELESQAGPMFVRSTFELSTEQRGAIQKVLNETFSAAVKINFETAPEVLSGIELTSNGHKVSWSIAEYLTSMKKNIGELLKKQASPESESQTNTEKQVKSEAPLSNLDKSK